MAADDAVCLSATEIRRGDEARGDWGGDAAGDDAASSSRNANGPPASTAGGSTASSSSSGAVLGDWGEPGDLGDLGGDGAGDGAGDLAGDLAGDGAGDPAGDRVAGCAVAGVVRVPAVEDDARPLAYCAWRSTRETLRFGVVLAPHAGLGAVLGLDVLGVGSVRRARGGRGRRGRRGGARLRASPAHRRRGRAVKSRSRSASGQRGWRRPRCGARRGFRALRVFRPSEDMPKVEDVGILAPPTADASMPPSAVPTDLKTAKVWFLHLPSQKV